MGRRRRQPFAGRAAVPLGAPRKDARWPCIARRLRAVQDHISSSAEAQAGDRYLFLSTEVYCVFTRLLVPSNFLRAKRKSSNENSDFLKLVSTSTLAQYQL